MDHQSSPQLAGSYDKEPGPRLGRLGILGQRCRVTVRGRSWIGSGRHHDDALGKGGKTRMLVDDHLMGGL
jgi:hypothetical protein